MKKVFEKDKLLPEIAGLVQEGYAVTIPVRGNSMLPFLRDGRDAVSLAAIDPETLSAGAVVLARVADGRIVLHRLIRRSGDRLWLQGDGNAGQVEIASIAEVWAVAVAVIRRGRTYPVDGWVWRVYSWCWLRLGRTRRYVLAVCRKIGL